MTNNLIKLSKQLTACVQSVELSRFLLSPSKCRLSLAPPRKHPSGTSKSYRDNNMSDRLTLDGSESGDERGAAGRGRAGAVEAPPLVHGWRRLNCDLMLEVCAEMGEQLRVGIKNFSQQRAFKMCAPSPDGRLMRFPSLSLRRERLNLPFLFFTLGLSLLSWKMRMLSSRSSTLISRSANCCSRRFSSSSWDFCWRAARVSSSSLERNS